MEGVSSYHDDSPESGYPLTMLSAHWRDIPLHDVISQRGYHPPILPIHQFDQRFLELLLAAILKKLKWWGHEANFAPIKLLLRRVKMATNLRLARL